MLLSQFEQKKKNNFLACGSNLRRLFSRAINLSMNVLGLLYQSSACIIKADTLYVKLCVHSEILKDKICIWRWNLSMSYRRPHDPLQKRYSANNANIMYVAVNILLLSLETFKEHNFLEHYQCWSFSAGSDLICSTLSENIYNVVVIRTSSEWKALLLLVDFLEKRSCPWFQSGDQCCPES